MKNKATEFGIFVVGGIGLFIAFTLFYNAPSFIFSKVVSILHNILH